jgi:N-acylneuraminate cytidylyltransferase/CMP-N,N'-diacetyllegionaminic acid synthase
MNTLLDNGCMKSFLRQDLINKNRQELPVFYRLNGAIYLFDCAYLKAEKDFYGNETYAYLMPAERSVDIEDEFDLKFAEFLISRRNKLRKTRKKKEI